MNCLHPILISNYFHHNSLVTRESASLLIEKISSSACYYVEVDFSGIIFISRSFADQFHKEKIALWESGQKEIAIINAHHDVLEMLKTVSRTQSKSNLQAQEYVVIEFENRRSLKEYLLSL